MALASLVKGVSKKLDYSGWVSCGFLISSGTQAITLILQFATLPKSVPLMRLTGAAFPLQTLSYLSFYIFSFSMTSQVNDSAF